LLNVVDVTSWLTPSVVLEEIQLHLPKHAKGVGHCIGSKSTEFHLSVVIALDTNSTRLALARHNAQIYGVADRIEFIQTDYISFARAYLALGSPNSRRKIDVVFLSPPWGGPSYLSGPTPPAESVELDAVDMAHHPTYSLASIQPIHGKDLFILTRKITLNVAYYLPRNTCLTEISDLLKDTDRQGNSIHLSGEQIEVEEEWMGDKLKALTCYFGGLVAGQDHLF